LNAPQHPSGLPVIYHNAEYGFTFFLPSSWRGYSVMIQQWDGERYLAAVDRPEVTDHGPVIVLRHPQWKASDPYQDIPIRVFTRSQWEGGGQGPPAIDAGGVDSEIVHNAKYVIAIHSRFNWDESVKGHEEAGTIFERNQTANGPHLHGD
jgi:hypothetical protein